MNNEKVIFLAIATIAFTLIAFAVFPSAVFAAITINTPTLLPQGNINTNQQVSITTNVVSTNDITGVVLEMKNSTSDLSNSSISNYTLGLVGARTNGNWIIFFGGNPGIYQINRIFATDNTTAVQTADYTGTFIGFRIIGAAATSTTTTTSIINVTTTTTTQTTTTTGAATTSITTTTTTSIIEISPFEKILDFFTSNPIYVIIIALIIIVPIVILVIVLKRRPKDVLPEPQQEGSEYSQT